ncbi:MAG: VWA domain-containing protein [Gammaproteobacteria bacterium]|nr:VWA domain-containing protein [Gammaproteobacteria bacterium]
MELDFSELEGINIDNNGQGGMISSKNKVDIVFVIDDSASMEPLIDGLENNINNFIHSLQNSGNSIDFRIGFELYGDELFTHCNLTGDVGVFQRLLKDKRKLETGGDEITLVAVDMAADHQWRESCHKYIIIFTNEPLSTNVSYEKQLSQYDLLLQKLKDLGVKIYFLGKDCPDYRRFKEIKHCYYEPVEDYNSVDYSKLFETIGKSVSQQSGGVAHEGSSVPKGIYDEVFGLKTAENAAEKDGSERHDKV